MYNTNSLLINNLFCYNFPVIQENSTNIYNAHYYAENRIMPILVILSLNITYT